MAEKTLLVHHYKGPVWEGTDGSLVRGDSPQAKHYLPKDPDAIHWLELPVQTAAGQFATVSLICRIDTTGGLLPAGKPCDAHHAGDQERVAYSATYLFYTTKEAAVHTLDTSQLRFHGGFPAATLDELSSPKASRRDR
jgi:hypothetical protein